MKTAYGNQQCVEFNVSNKNRTVALDQTHLYIKWDQWLQIWTRSDHGYHTTAVHLVLVRHIFNGYIYILKIYAHCITLHYKMYKGCHKNWMIPIYMYPWIWKLDLFKAYKMCSFQEMWCSFLCLNIIHSLPLINDYMTCFCLKFEGNTHVNLTGNMWPKMKEQQKQTKRVIDL